MLSLNKNQANIEAIMGSPIGAAATIVGDTYLMAKYKEPCPSIVGTMPSNTRPPNSIIVKFVRLVSVNIAISKRVIAAYENNGLE